MSKRKKKREPQRVIVECPDLNVQLSALRTNTVAIERALIDLNLNTERVAIQLRRMADAPYGFYQPVADSIDTLRRELVDELRMHRVRPKGLFSRLLLFVRTWWQERAWRRHVKEVEEESVDLKAVADEIAERNTNGRWG